MDTNNSKSKIAKEGYSQQTSKTKKTQISKPRKQLT